MLRKPTVFVLGAGASAPFGFPTGAKLYSAVVHALNDDAAGFTFLQGQMGFGANQIRNFRQALFYSGKNSVDQFLEHRFEFIEIGKAAMAMILIGAEVEDALFAMENSWLRYTYERLNTSFDDFGGNAVSFITFNYDRSLEHFLFVSLKHSYGKTDQECTSEIAKIPIIHLYGRLGFLPWQHTAGRSYHHQIDGRVIRNAVQNMKIVHEDTSGAADDDFERAKELIAKAEQVYFLGFGYNEINMRRLDLRNVLSTSEARDTAVDIVGREKDRIDQYTAKKIQLQNLDCFSFVKQIVDWSSLFDV